MHETKLYLTFQVKISVARRLDGLAALEAALKNTLVNSIHSTRFQLGILKDPI